MKKFIQFTLVVASILMVFSSCYTSRHPHGHLPPGQAKKIYGGKSAKRYAPGQQKKRHKQHKPKRGKGHYKQDVMWRQGW